MEEKLIRLRKESGYSQGYIAEKLGMTRQSYILTEKGTRKPTSDNLEQLASIYGIPVEEFFFKPANTEKFKQMYLYTIGHFQKNGIPKTKLAKLLYLADFSVFYDDLEPMSGVNYLRKQYGPLADIFLELTDELYESGKINIDYLSRGAEIIKIKDKNEKSKIVPTTNLKEFGLLSERDKKRIDEICDFWYDRRTAEVVNFTHEQKPWMSCRDGEIIPYELILQEDPNHVYTSLA